MSVHIYESADELATAAAAHIADTIATSDRTVSLGLAGGGTPAASYQRLADLPVDWSRVVMWLGDERWVPHDDPESNTLMAREALVDRVMGRLLAPDTAFGDPHEAARRYAAQLAEVFHEGRPDLVLLGIGDDGHTASLFPGTEALAVTDTNSDRTYLANWVETKDTWRLTASFPLLWRAREIVFLVQGEGKSGVLAEIVDRHHPYPAQQVAAGAAQVRWLVDAAAASRLRSAPR